MASQEKKTNGKKTDTRIATMNMKEEMVLIGTLEETMITDRTTKASREEKKKTEVMEDRIGDKKEDHMITKIMEDIGVTAGRTETEEIMEEPTMATIEQGPEGLARGLLASGGLLQATPWP